MKKLHRTLTGRFIRLAIFFLLAAMLFTGTTFWSSTKVEANHPVLVEGNCDSPSPGTTLVTIEGTCGDWDGDGRIGTAEDTDGADRIFGTLAAALGPGTGAAAGTGANHNGTILIVASGRFAETLFIGNNGIVPGQGVGNPGNLTIEAAPGVEADIDAILQGDPAGGNTTRTGQIGIFVVYTPASSNHVVTLRNLTIRNWAEGVASALSSRIHIDRCRFEGNIGNGVHLIDNGQVVITNSQFVGQGRREGIGSSTPAPGNGILIDGNSQARISDTTISYSAAAGIRNNAPAANVVLFKVGTYFNNPDIVGPVTIAPSPNSAN